MSVLGSPVHSFGAEVVVVVVVDVTVMLGGRVVAVVAVVTVVVVAVGGGDSEVDEVVVAWAVVGGPEVLVDAAARDVVVDRDVLGGDVDVVANPLLELDPALEQAPTITANARIAHPLRIPQLPCCAVVAATHLDVRAPS